MYTKSLWENQELGRTNFPVVITSGYLNVPWPIPDKEPHPKRIRINNFSVPGGVPGSKFRKLFSRFRELGNLMVSPISRGNYFLCKSKVDSGRAERYFQ